MAHHPTHRGPMPSRKRHIRGAQTGCQREFRERTGATMMRTLPAGRRRGTLAGAASIADQPVRREVGKEAACSQGRASQEGTRRPGAKTEGASAAAGSTRSERRAAERGHLLRHWRALVLRTLLWACSGRGDRVRSRTFQPARAHPIRRGAPGRTDQTGNRSCRRPHLRRRRWDTLVAADPRGGDSPSADCSRAEGRRSAPACARHETSNG